MLKYFLFFYFHVIHVSQTHLSLKLLFSGNSQYNIVYDVFGGDQAA